MIESSAVDGNIKLELMPNSSASHQQVRLFILLIAGLSFTIAVAWTFVGAWIVLPFAGFEVGLVGYLLLKVHHKTQHKQVITFSGDTVHFQEGRYRPEREAEFNRFDLVLNVTKPHSKLDELKLALVSKDIHIPLGHFLTEEERKEVRALVREQGIIETVNRWWEKD